MPKNVRLVLIFSSIFIVVLLSFLFRSPQPSAPHAPALPSERPHDLIIAYSYGVGMTERWSSAYLSEKQSYAETVNGPVRNKVSFSMDAAELDTLYTTFRTSHFDSLVHTTQEINDGGGGTVSLTWGNNTVAQPLGDGIVMSKDNQAAMDVVWQALQSVVQKKMAAMSVPLKIRTVGIPKTASVSLSIDDSPNLYDFPDAAHFVPGQHLLDISVQLSTGKNITLHEPFTLPGHAATVVVTIINKELEYTIR